MAKKRNSPLDTAMPGLEEEVKSPPDSSPVTCLGQTFENDTARREYFTQRLREKLQDPEFRKIEGFPLGSDEDILALSDPPYYTACPNPFLEEFVTHYGQPYDPESDDYHREPFAADVSEGKNDPIYNAHSYHTKVPHKAIMRYILHYTDPGDLVLDGFCGTGMTGVAAQLCGDRDQVQSLGHTVKPDGSILDAQGAVISKLGARRAVLNDLSPAATFIAYNYNTPVDSAQFRREAERILREVEDECGWMYRTVPANQPELVQELVTAFEGVRTAAQARELLNQYDQRLGTINYTVWSDVFLCPECSHEMVFWDVAVDTKAGQVRDSFSCPGCQAELTKNRLQRAWQTVWDLALKESLRQARQSPVLINYSFGSRTEKQPDAFDVCLNHLIDNLEIPNWFPTDMIPNGDKTGEPLRIGISHVHHFYTKRNRFTLSNVYSKSRECIYQHSLVFWINAANRYLSKMSKLGTAYYFHGGGGAVNAGLLGTLYIPSFSVENSVITNLNTRIVKLEKALNLFPKEKSYIETISSTNRTLVNDSSIDYIFTDPPFGSNIMYSELNFLWESWLKVHTNNRSEAIENKVQKKGLHEYQQLMTRSFQEYYRILKPGRWMTVEFHNSANAVWNAIQEGLQFAGFVVADVRTLDKKQGTFKQTPGSNSVKQDLVISAYKPTHELEKQFGLKAGSETAMWEFVRAHLAQLPVCVENNGEIEAQAERMDYLLFDRMVAFHVQRGISVPMSAREFYAGLLQYFQKEDGMFFLPAQKQAYLKRREKAKKVLQLSLFVQNESSAIEWLRSQLGTKPMTYQELNPLFMQQLKAWLKQEKNLELLELLQENFLCYEGHGPIPQKIASWLRQSEPMRELIAREAELNEEGELITRNSELLKKASDRWYEPDAGKAIDLEKIRHKALLREFETYKTAKKRLAKVRLEAVRAGFEDLARKQDFKSILALHDQLPKNTIEEDPILLRWYDFALLSYEE